MRRWKAFLNACITFFSPVALARFWPEVRRLAAGQGWMPPMLLFSILGIVVPVNFVVGQVWGIRWLAYFNLFASITWSALAVVAMAKVGSQSVSAISRLRLWGMLRPRWWFELARVCWFVVTIAGAGVVLQLFLPRQWLVGHGLLSIAPAALALMAFLAFFVFATLGYLLSFARALPRTGRAYECTHFFFSIAGPMVLVGYAAACWPLGGNGPDLVQAVLIGILGAAWMLCGFVSIIFRQEKLERRRGTRGLK